MARDPGPTRAVQTAVVRAVKLGAHMEVAARQASLDPERLRKWLDAGERDEAAGRKTKARALFEAVRAAEVKAEIAAVRAWQRAIAGDGDHRAAREFLAARWPERWGPRGRLAKEVEAPPAKSARSQPSGSVPTGDPRDFFRAQLFGQN